MCHAAVISQSFYMNCNCCFDSMNFHERLRIDAFSSYHIPETYVNDSLTTHGWLDTENFIAAFDRLTTLKTTMTLEDPFILEVGTWKGKSACAMASHLKASNKKGRILCIDTWLGAPEFWTWGIDDETRGGSLHKRHGYPTVYETFLANVKFSGHDDTIAPLPLSSIQAAEVLAYYKIEPDVVYIDASHEETAVLADMEAYFPLVKKGGGLFGDDYMAWHGVRRAVDAFVEKHPEVSLTVSGEIWCIMK